MDGLMDGDASATSIGATGTAVAPTSHKGKVRVRLTRKGSRPKPQSRAAGRVTQAIISILLAILAVAATAESSYAAFGIVGFDGAVNADADGNAYTQAGGHPFSVSTDIAFNTTTDPMLGVPIADGDPKTIRVDLPVGLIGNPAAVPTCRADDFFRLTVSTNGCPIETQVGVATVQSADTPENQPLYSIEPPSRDVPAAFGFSLAGVPIILNARVRTDSDYGITIVAPEINQGVPLTSTRVEIWGTPYASTHDIYRCKKYVPVSGEQRCNPDHLSEESRPQSVSGSAKAFMTLPTVCTAPGVGLETRLAADSWQEPGVFHRASFMSHLPPGYPAAPGPEQGPENCDGLPFEPVVDLQPTSGVAGKPTGVNVDIDVPQAGLVNPGGLATAHLKKVEVTLPEGVAISPSAADGLQGCTDAQIGFENVEKPQCPAASKVGTVEIETPVLAESLQGDVYIGASKPGQIFRLLLFAQGGGVTLKLEGKVNPDPVTGRITTVFDDNPQLPFTKLRLSLKSGPRAPLSNPPECGTYETTARLTSWSGQTKTLQSTYNVDCVPDLGTFNPGFRAGTLNPAAGASSPFSLSVAREDGMKELKAIRSVRLPEGLLGRVGSVPLCDEAQAAAGTCPESSRVGHVQAALGSGASPLWVPQAGKEPTAVYLSGPYRGAPYSLSIVVPAQAGPFDLGRVVVRSALHVDERTAAITTGIDETRLIDTNGAVTDVLPEALPTILKGVVLRQREIRVIMDREDFMINPTDCSPKEITAEVYSVDGDRVDVGNRFRAVDCARLGFKPKFRAKILNKGRKSTLRSFHPRARFTVVPRKGDANIGAARVVLPSSTLLDQANIGTTCTRAQMAERACPEASIVGYAKAWSPLLRETIEGPVYLAANGGVRPLPDLAAVMDGEIRVVLQGEIATQRSGGKARLQNTFRVVPDAPVSRFVLTMRGGKKTGLLVNSTDLCRSNERGSATFIGQNNRRSRTALRLTPSFKGCGKVRRQVAKRKLARRSVAGKSTVGQARAGSSAWEVR